MGSGSEASGLGLTVKANISIWDHGSKYQNFGIKDQYFRLKFVIWIWSHVPFHDFEIKIKKNKNRSNGKYIINTFEWVIKL